MWSWLRARRERGVRDGSGRTGVALHKGGHSGFGQADGNSHEDECIWSSEER